MIQKTKKTGKTVGEDVLKMVVEINKTNTLKLHDKMVEFYVDQSTGSLGLIETSLRWKNIERYSKTLGIDGVGFILIGSYALQEAFRIVHGGYDKTSDIIKNFNN